MDYLKKLLIILIGVFLATQLSACTKTVRWEEEVPLNTGEVILVSRKDFFVQRSEPGNPFKMGWWIKKRSYRFHWQGKDYSYTTRHANGPIILYVYIKEKTVSIIDDGWPKCSGYAEFRWTGGEWKIQKDINRAIIGRPVNIMDYYSAIDGKIPARVTQEFIRNSHFYLPQKGSSLTHLMGSETASNCKE